MNRIVIAATAIAAFAFTAPAHAQEEPEEPRTTYSVRMIDLAPGAEERFMEIEEKYAKPTREALGQAQPTIHYIMAGSEYDLIIVSEMENGMAAFDTHSNPDRAAFFAKMTELVGGEEAFQELTKEYMSLIVKSKSIYTHTHP